jgi:hypothetical protein
VVDHRFCVVLYMGLGVVQDVQAVVLLRPQAEQLFPPSGVFTN